MNKEEFLKLAVGTFSEVFSSGEIQLFKEIDDFILIKPAKDDHLFCFELTGKLRWITSCDEVGSVINGIDDNSSHLFRSDLRQHLLNNPDLYLTIVVYQLNHLKIIDKKTGSQIDWIQGY